MRTKKLKNILIAIAFISIGSCNNITEDPIFEDSAATRANEDIANFSNQLTTAEFGWILENFPGRTQALGGYNYALKFNEDKSVEVSSERQTDFTMPESSTYNLINNGGTVLTFDTYNSVMHEFSTPSAQQYQAQGGDFEFRLLKESDNVISAIGKTSRNNLRLVKLNEKPEEYLTKVQTVSDFLDGAVYLLNDAPVAASNRNFTFTTEENPITVAYIHTSDGIKLYEPITLNGDTIDKFTLDTDNAQLVSPSGNTILKIAFAPFDIGRVWTFNVLAAGDVSTLFFNTFVQIFNANRTVYSETLDAGRTFFGGSPFSTFQPLNAPGIIFRSNTATGGFWAQYNLSFSNNFGANYQLGISKASGGFNRGFYGHLEPLVDLIADNSPYNVQATPADSPTEVILTSSTNPDVWFTIRLF